MGKIIIKTKTEKTYIQDNISVMSDLKNNAIFSMGISELMFEEIDDFSGFASSKLGDGLTNIIITNSDVQNLSLNEAPDSLKEVTFINCKNVSDVILSDLDKLSLYDCCVQNANMLEIFTGELCYENCSGDTSALDEYIDNYENYLDEKSL